MSLDLVHSMRSCSSTGCRSKCFKILALHDIFGDVKIIAHSQGVEKQNQLLNCVLLCILCMRENSHRGFSSNSQLPRHLQNFAPVSDERSWGIPRGPSINPPGYFRGPLSGGQH